MLFADGMVLQAVDALARQVAAVQAEAQRQRRPATAGLPPAPGDNGGAGASAAWVVCLARGQERWLQLAASRVEAHPVGLPA